MWTREKPTEEGVYAFTPLEHPHAVLIAQIHRVPNGTLWCRTFNLDIGLVVIVDGMWHPVVVPAPPGCELWR